MEESTAFTNDQGKRGKSMMYKKLGACFWRDEFQCVSEGEIYSAGRMAGNKGKRSRPR